MPKSARETRSTTCSGKSQRVEIFIKKEEDKKITYGNPSQHKLAAMSTRGVPLENLNNQHNFTAIPTTDPTAKFEDGDLKFQLAKVESEKDTSIFQTDQKIYCEVCCRGFLKKVTYTKHLNTATHKRMSFIKQVLPGEFDPNLHCNVCNKVFGKLHYCRRHLKEHHKMELTPLKPKPDSNISPNPDNANNHCDSCNWTYTIRKSYRHHLIDMHKLIIPPRIQRATSNPTLLPDVDAEIFPFVFQ